MITFTLRVVAPTAKRRELVGSVGALLAETRAQPGCVDARLYADTEDPNAIALIEEWDSWPDLDRHLAADAGRTILAAMESSTVLPEVRFDSVEHRAGLEVFAEARRARAERQE
jgi:quinol monooxygenase YgiN